MLCDYVQSRNNSLLWRSESISLLPCLPTNPACHLTLPSILQGQPPYPASHPTLPPTQPCQPPVLASNPALPSCLSSSGTVALQTLQGTGAVLVLLHRLCVWGASQIATPSNILHTPPNITPPKILHTPSKILHSLLSNNLRNPSLHGFRQNAKMTKISS